MSSLSTSQDRAPETRRIVVAISTTQVEVGLHHKQLCHASTHSPPSDRCCMVLVDRLTKLAHFIPIHMTYPVSTFQDQIIRLHGVPRGIVSNRNPRFISSFQRSFQRERGMKTKFCTTYHPKTDGQFERTIQILHDLHRLGMIDFCGSWKEHLSLVELAYNNSYQSIIGMTPFEAFYGRPCRLQTCLLEGGELLIVGLELLQDSKRIIKFMRQRLTAPKDRQGAYAD